MKYNLKIFYNLKRHKSSDSEISTKPDKNKNKFTARYQLVKTVDNKNILSANREEKIYYHQIKN